MPINKAYKMAQAVRDGEVSLEDLLEALMAEANKQPEEIVKALSEMTDDRCVSAILMGCVDKLEVVAGMLGG